MKLNLKKLSKNCRILCVVMIGVILISLFAPKNFMGIRLSGHIGDVSGSIGFETFSGILPEGKALIKKAENTPTLCMWYAPWCGWSKKAFKPFAEAAKSNPACTLLAINCDEHKDLAKQHGITGYPDIRLYPTGLSGSHIVHTGERTAKGLLNFIKNNL